MTLYERYHFLAYPGIAERVKAVLLPHTVFPLNRLFEPIINRSTNGM